MRIVVTGAGGFIGQHVVSNLNTHEIIALDSNLDCIPDADHITKITGDIRDRDILAAAFANGCDAVIHLANVPGGAAEDNPILAKSVNIDATIALIDIAAKSSEQPRFVFASSIAVFGKLPIADVIDEAPTAPTMLYGAHKLMIENWIACQTRRGAIDGLSLRLPGVVARPKSPSGMKSAFLSDIFHTIREGKDFIMPLSEDATTWLCSASVAAKNLAFTAKSDRIFKSENRTILAPTLSVKIPDLEQEVRKQFGNSESIIRYTPEAYLEAMFGQHPKVQTPSATNFGLSRDVNLETLVKHVVQNI